MHLHLLHVRLSLCANHLGSLAHLFINTSEPHTSAPNNHGCAVMSVLGNPVKLQLVLSLAGRCVLVLTVLAEENAPPGFARVPFLMRHLCLGRRRLLEERGGCQHFLYEADRGERERGDEKMR